MQGDNEFLFQLNLKSLQHNISMKICSFTELMSQHVHDTDEFTTLEIWYHHQYGLLPSNLGISKLCSVMLSKLHKAHAHSSHRSYDYPRRTPGKNVLLKKSQ